MFPAIASLVQIGFAMAAAKNQLVAVASALREVVRWLLAVATALREVVRWLVAIFSLPVAVVCRKRTLIHQMRAVA